MISKFPYRVLLLWVGGQREIGYTSSLASAKQKARQAFYAMESRPMTLEISHADGRRWTATQTHGSGFLWHTC